MIDAYVLGSNEFVPVTVSDNDVPLTSPTNVEISLVSVAPGWPAPPPDVWQPAASDGLLIGFMTGSLTVAGVYAVYVRVTDPPQQPVLFAGRIQVY